ncbi:MAG: hypothetical protein B0D92_00345 [Spirochaeta sp. LUC14_002_19_P3]|nr:MAG: hypothetical protein B0D92_00345 [Spirochaeta sp. LUC14_002_19_P3]
MTVLIILFGVIGYLSWDAYKIRAARKSDFVSRSQEYTRLLTETLVNERDITAEIDMAKMLLSKDPLLIAVQVYSPDSGLRLSTVKPSAAKYSSSPVAEDGKFGSIFRFHYQTIKQPMNIANMTNLYACFIGTMYTYREINEYLLLVLVTTGGLFLLTLIITLIQPRKPSQNTIQSVSKAPMPNRYGAKLANDELDGDEFYGEISKNNKTSDMEADMEADNEYIDQLAMELASAEAFNQDLTIILFSTSRNNFKTVRKFYSSNPYVIVINDRRIGIIDVNNDYDTALKKARKFVYQQNNQNFRVGISSRNSRIINAPDLYEEAETALLKTDEGHKIVAFRSDPQKYLKFATG